MPARLHLPTAIFHSLFHGYFPVMISFILIKTNQQISNEGEEWALGEWGLKMCLFHFKSPRNLAA